MLQGIESRNLQLAIQQPHKNDARTRGVESSVEQNDRSAALKEKIANGEYKIDTHQTATKMALYLLNKE